VNILLLQLKRIGDLVLTTPAIGALRQTFPDARIMLVVSNDSAELAPAIPGVQQVLVMRRNARDLGGFLTITRNRFDYCVDFTQNNRSALLSALSRARKRVASYRIKRRSPLRRKAYNEFIERRMRDMHTVDYNLALLEPLGIHGLSPPVHLNLHSAVYDKADDLRRRSGIQDSFVIFHPGSARVEKFWEPDRWAEVIASVVERWKVTAVLTGGKSPQETAHLAEIKSKLRSPPAAGAFPGVTDLSGRIDLLTLTALIAQARLLVTVDTAPVHLAAAMRTPQVALFGPTNPFHWQPRGVPAIILQSEMPGPMREFVPRQSRLPMKLISTRAVIDAIHSLLSAPAAQAL
jgi:predicted lipopolysaccharide heptosyltransferase III